MTMRLIIIESLMSGEARLRVGLALHFFESP